MACSWTRQAADGRRYVVGQGNRARDRNRDIQVPDDVHARGLFGRPVGGVHEIPRIVFLHPTPNSFSYSGPQIQLHIHSDVSGITQVRRYTSTT